MSSVDEEPIRVLHVDDEPDLAEVVALGLERQRERITVLPETSAADGMNRLTNDDVDCVVSDHDMPERNGLEFLKDVRDGYPELPFILFTGKGSEEIASDAISAGVTEYLQKGTGTEQYALLANRIERAVSATRAKTALEESERMLSTLIANLPGMVYRCQNESGWPMEFVSDGARDLTGYAPDRIQSGAVGWAEQVVVDADREGLWEQVQRALAAGEPFEVTYRIETSDGERRWVWERGRAIDRRDGMDLIEGFITDITARKQREQELQAERGFTRNVVDSLEDTFFVIGKDGGLVRWNDSVNEVTGYSDAEIASMNATEFLDESDHERVQAEIARALDGETVRVETTVVTKDGTKIPYEFHGTALTDTIDGIEGVAGIGRDVSEQNARERTFE